MMPITNVLWIIIIIIQSPKALYKDPTDYTKPNKTIQNLEYLTEPENIRQNYKY